MSGDPRRGPVGADTAVPDPLHTPKDTGIHGISGGDARSGWLHGEPRDRLQQQEEDDIRKAVKFPTSVTTRRFQHLSSCKLKPCAKLQDDSHRALKLRELESYTPGRITKGKQTITCLCMDGRKIDRSSPCTAIVPFSLTCD